MPVGYRGEPTARTGPGDLPPLISDRAKGTRIKPGCAAHGERQGRRRDSPSASSGASPGPASLPPEISALSSAWVEDENGHVKPLGVPALEAIEDGLLTSTATLEGLTARGLVTEYSRPSPEEYWRANLITLGTLLSAPLEAALRAGEWELARRIVAEYHLKRGDRVNAGQMMRASDDAARAAAVVMRTIAWGKLGAKKLGFDAVSLFERADNDPESKRTVFDRFHEMSRLLRGMQADLNLAERVRVLYLGSSPSVSQVVVESDRQMGHGFRACLREDPRPDASAVSIRLRASVEGLRAFCQRYADQPGFRGVRPSVINEWSSSGKQGRGVYASVGVDLEIDGVPTRLELVHRNGKVSAISPRIVNARIRTLLKHNDLDQDLLVTETVLPVRAAHFGVNDLEVEELSPERSSLSSGEALGPRVCAHRRSRWEEDRIAMTMRLVCNDCYHGSVVELPFHRLEPSHPIMRELTEDGTAYLAARDARAALLEQPGDEGFSVSQLRARDGIARLRASDYAFGMTRDASPAVSSVASAMNRR